jgi:predicted nucleic acid-binding protein
MTFLDSNVLVYAVDVADRRKNGIALDIVSAALDTPRNWRISTQVLSEFSNVLLRKLSCPTPRLIAFLDQFAGLVCLDMTPSCVRRAVEIQALYGMQFFDAQMIAAAEASGCSKILSEDFNPGQTYCGLVAENPFA